VHALDARDCPFDARVATRLTEAGERARAELVVETDFDPERAGRSAASRPRPTSMRISWSHTATSRSTT
jgi:aminoglycoside phosphotransferase